MKPLLKLNYMANDFDVPAPNHAGGTLGSRNGTSIGLAGICPEFPNSFI